LALDKLALDPKLDVALDLKLDVALDLKLDVALDLKLDVALDKLALNMVLAKRKLDGPSKYLMLDTPSSVVLGKRHKEILNRSTSSQTGAWGRSL
jgi:hypothetical protein